MRQSGPVEHAIRAHLRSGQQLTTPSQGKPFTIRVIDDRGVELLLGAKQAQTRFSWPCLEGIPAVLSDEAWTPIGSSYDVAATPGTLDAYLKKHVNRATAGWIAAMLEAAGVVEIDRCRPARVRLAAPA